MNRCAFTIPPLVVYVCEIVCERQSVCACRADREQPCVIFNWLYPRVLTCTSGTIAQKRYPSWRFVCVMLGASSAQRSRWGAAIYSASRESLFIIQESERDLGNSETAKVSKRYQGTVRTNHCVRGKPQSVDNIWLWIKQITVCEVSGSRWTKSRYWSKRSVWRYTKVWIKEMRVEIYEGINQRDRSVWSQKPSTHLRIAMCNHFGAGTASSSGPLSVQMSCAVILSEDCFECRGTFDTHSFPTESNLFCSLFLGVPGIFGSYIAPVRFKYIGVVVSLETWTWCH